MSIVIFDSRVPIGTGQAAYMTATAERLAGAELERGIEVFSRRSQEHGARPWTTADIHAPAVVRLYRATASEHWVLDPDTPTDRRARVTLLRRSGRVPRPAATGVAAGMSASGSSATQMPRRAGQSHLGKGEAQ